MKLFKKNEKKETLCKDTSIRYFHDSLCRKRPVDGGE